MLETDKGALIWEPSSSDYWAMLFITKYSSFRNQIKNGLGGLPLLRRMTYLHNQNTVLVSELHILAAKNNDEAQVWIVPSLKSINEFRGPELFVIKPSPKKHPYSAETTL